MAKKPDTSERIDIIEMRKGVVRFCVLGVTPLICEAMSFKAKQQLFMPPPKKTRAQKATTLKHEPLREFRDSVYEMPEGAPTKLAANAMWFKAAMTSAAIDVPGATKAELGRLAIVQGELLPLYGLPKLKADMVRQSDMARTPTFACAPVSPNGPWWCRSNFIARN